MLAKFRLQFPEFSRADDTLVNAKLADAARMVDATEYGEKAEMARLYLTAHLICLSPFGQQARLVGKDGATTYSRFLEQIDRGVGLGCRVV